MKTDVGFRLAIALFLSATIIGFLSDEDKDKQLDGKHIVQYNCYIMMEGWKDTVSPEVLEKCKIPKKQKETH